MLTRSEIAALIITAVVALPLIAVGFGWFIDRLVQIAAQ